MHYAWSYSNNALSKLEQYIASENLSMKAGNSQYTYVCVKILKIRIVIWSRHLFENFERCIDNTSLYILIISGHPFFFFYHPLEERVRGKIGQSTIAQYIITMNSKLSLAYTISSFSLSYIKKKYIYKSSSLRETILSTISPFLYHSSFL